jgi:hypothetical protein
MKVCIEYRYVMVNTSLYLEDCSFLNIGSGVQKLLGGHAHADADARAQIAR